MKSVQQGLAAKRLVQLIQNDTITHGLRERSRKWLMNEASFEEVPCDTCRGEEILARDESEWPIMCMDCDRGFVTDMEPPRPQYDEWTEKALAKAEYVIFGCPHCCGIWVVAALKLAETLGKRAGISWAAARLISWLAREILAPAAIVSWGKKV